MTVNKPISILFLAAFDSMNYAYPPIIAELQRRGHRHLILVRDRSDEINTKMFRDSHVPPATLDEFCLAELESFDLLILPQVRVREFERLVQAARDAGIPTVSFSFLFSSIVMRYYPDLVLTLGAQKAREFQNNHLHYNFIAVGNPQYDYLVRNPRCEPPKNILIVDQGGYPYGDIGKQQFAGLISSLCRSNPNLTFVLKPRYTKSEIGMGQTTHQLSDQLLDFLDSGLPNLRILNKPNILEQVIMESDAMISTWSTAALAGFQAGIPMMIVEGFDSIDVFDVRHQRVQEAYDELRGSGLVIQYTDIVPESLHFGQPPAHFLADMIFKPGTKSSPRIVSILEAIVREGIGREWFPSGPVNLDADSFLSELKNHFTRRMDTDLARIHRTACDRVNAVLQEAVYLNRCMGNLLDLGPLTDFAEAVYTSSDATELSYINLEKQMHELIAEIERVFFVSESAQKKISGDMILQDFYLDWLFRTRQYDRIMNPDFRVIASGSLAYYQSRILFPRHRRESLLKLDAFLGELFDRGGLMIFLKEKRLAQSLLPYFEGINALFMTFWLICSKRQAVFLSLNDGAVIQNPVLGVLKVKALISVRDFVAASNYAARYAKIQDRKLIGRITRQAGKYWIRHMLRKC